MDQSIGPNEIQIRLASPDDAEQMQRIHTNAARTLCAPHYTREQIDIWLYGRTPAGYLEAIQRGEMRTAEIAGEPVGFAHAVQGEVLAIFVSPEWGNRGVGRALLSETMRIATRDHVGPIRLEATLNAVPFYKRFGFLEVRRGAVTKRGVDIPIVEMEKRT